MASYTEHYGLHQWEATDNFLRTDFNTDHALIDAALAGLEGDKAEIVKGVYTGNGAETRSISLGFTPAVLLIVCQDGTVCNGTHCFGGLAFPGQPCFHLNRNAIEIVENGFKVGYYRDLNTSVNTNGEDEIYFYLAVR